MMRRSEMPPVPPQPWSEPIPADSFYARLVKWRDVLVEDGDYVPLYRDSRKERPSIPPSLVVVAMLLAYHGDCSDAKAEQRMRFDLRWKHTLRLGLEDEGFDSTVLCRFRRKLLERAEFSADRQGLRALERWARRFPERRWAVEGTNGLGRTLAYKLASIGEEVVDVLPKLSARVRVLSVGNGRKNNGLDATCAALAAWRNGRLAQVRPDDWIDVLRLLCERREDLVSERTRVLNRLHTLLLRDLIPGGVPGRLSADRTSRILRSVRPRRDPCSTAESVRWQLNSELLRDVRALNRRIADLDARIRQEVEASGIALTDIFGVGPILAAKIITLVGDAGRFSTKGHFASYAGVAPVEVSSGEVVRHRLSLAGNRRLKVTPCT
jgi:transposase